MTKNKYIGKWIEPEAKNIEMPYTCENLNILLITLASKKNLNFSHQDFVNWCEKFYNKIDTASSLGIDNIRLKKLSEVLNDISMQWELYLTNTYELEELQQLVYSEVELPCEWFENWLNQLQN